MIPLTNLYPRLITKEDLLTPNELAPFKNFSSQVNPHFCYLFSHRSLLEYIKWVLESCLNKMFGTCDKF